MNKMKRKKIYYDKIVDKKNIVCIFFLIFFLLLRLVQLRLHFNCAHCGVCVFVHSIQNDHYDFWRWLRATFQHSRFHIDTNFIATICVATMLLLLWFVGVVQNKKKTNLLFINKKNVWDKVYNNGLPSTVCFKAQQYNATMHGNYYSFWWHDVIFGIVAVIIILLFFFFVSFCFFS